MFGNQTDEETNRMYNLPLYLLKNSAIYFYLVNPDAGK